MIIYKMVQRFNPNTGKPIAVKGFHQIRSDYSGMVLEEVNSDDYPLYYGSICLDYGDQDPCYGSDGDEFDFGEKYKIYMHDFLSQPYKFYSETAENNEFEGFAKDFAASGMGLQDFLRDIRIKAATKLLESGEIESWQLSREDD